VEVPPILDKETYHRAKIRRERWIANRPGNINFEYHTGWLHGLAYCAGDGWKLGLSFSQRVQNFISDVTWYRCTYRHHMHTQAENCVQSIRMDWLDRFAWDKLYSFIRDPVAFEERIAQRFDQLQARQEYTTQNLDVLTKRLEDLKEERRRVATMFRRNLISEDEMADQLQVVGDEEIEITEQIANAGNDYGDELEKIRGLSRVYRDYLAEGLEGLDIEPNDPELFRRWSATVKGIIQALVQRVEVDNGLNVTIHTHIDLRTKLPGDKRVYSSESLLVSLGNKEPVSRTTFLPQDNSLGLRVL